MYTTLFLITSEEEESLHCTYIYLYRKVGKLMFFKAVDASRLNGDLETTYPSYMILPLSGRIENTGPVRN